MTATLTAAPAGTRVEPYRLSPPARRVFVGLMLGMLVASISQTIVGPAMPRIVAELGGMDHYSWVATAAMLVSAITVPIVGKLSDLYGRRGFYLAGLGVFMVARSSAASPAASGCSCSGAPSRASAWAPSCPCRRPSSATSSRPRQRGKYQGLMGAVFGVTSVAGPLAGGFITDHFGWRWLFFAAVPIGLVTTAVIARFLHLPHERREARIDYLGIATLTVALVSLLLATSLGGTTWAWSSPEILGLYAVGVASLIAFVLVEGRAEEPVIPLRLFRSRIFTAANVASFAVSMVMFGSIIYIPVYAQGVLGVDATNSGLILMPLMLGLIVMGILAGLVITRTGRYKAIMLTGVVVMGAGLYLLTRLTATSSQTQLTLAMVVLGIGLGMAMQQYTLVVQNSVQRTDLGVATASTQFFRNVGSTVGIAVFGTVMTSGLAAAITSHLPAEVAARMPAGAVDAGSVLDPSALAGLPAVVADAVRQGLADQLHEVFLIALPLALVVFVATLAIKAVPLRDTANVEVAPAEEAGHELLDSMGQATARA